MNSFLLNRQLGAVRPREFANAQHNRLLSALQPASNVNFALQQPDGARHDTHTRDLAHAAGVSSIAIDRFEGR